jgi:hypothetical protein
MSLTTHPPHQPTSNNPTLVWQDKTFVLSEQHLDAIITFLRNYDKKVIFEEFFNLNWRITESQDPFITGGFYFNISHANNLFDAFLDIAKAIDSEYTNTTITI